MDTKEKLSKFDAPLTTVRGGARQEPTKTLSDTERADKIQYLKNLFRLSFRTNTAYEECMREATDEDQYYEACLELSVDGNPAGFGRDDEELEDFRADFQKLGAEDEFVQCCIDYYEDVMQELKHKYPHLQEKLAAATARCVSDAEIVAASAKPTKYNNLRDKKMAAQMSVRQSIKQKTVRENLAEKERIQERVNANLERQKAVQAKLRELYQTRGKTVPEKGVEK